MQYYINVKQKNRNTAGKKAPDDISEICARRGMKEFRMPMFPDKKKGKLYRKVWLFFVAPYYWMKLSRTVKEGDFVLFQHPVYGNRISDFFIPRIQKKKKCKFIAIIHDLESLRNGIQGVIEKSAKTNSIADEQLLKRFDAVICHNDFMKKYMVGKGFSEEKLVSLEIFDYLCTYQKTATVRNKKPSLCIAGNLAKGKSEYIYKLFGNDEQKLNDSLDVHLYGINYSEQDGDNNYIYHGSFSPDDLPAHLEGDWGLVWDGNSLEACTGNTGEYLRYNNPHKASLYLASGIPVIVWKSAAISKFVADKKLGIAVDAISEIDSIIENMTDEEYYEICSNVAGISDKLKSGYFFNKALDRAFELLK